MATVPIFTGHPAALVLVYYIVVVLPLAVWPFAQLLSQTASRLVNNFYTTFCWLESFLTILLLQLLLVDRIINHQSVILGIISFEQGLVTQSYQTKVSAITIIQLSDLWSPSSHNSMQGKCWKGIKKFLCRIELGVLPILSISPCFSIARHQPCRQPWRAAFLTRCITLQTRFDKAIFKRQFGAVFEGGLQKLQKTFFTFPNRENNVFFTLLPLHSNTTFPLCNLF
jgi:hypothetical protein